jgi:hypothetical protein
MEDDEYRDLIKMVAEQLILVGASDIADERHYVVDDVDTDERRLVEPRRQLIGMLQAFERFLAIQDKATYDAAFQLFNEQIPEGGPRAAIFLPTEGSVEMNPRNFATAPDLSEVRWSLRGLIDQLKRDPEPTPHRRTS